MSLLVKFAAAATVWILIQFQFHHRRFPKASTAGRSNLAAEAAIDTLISEGSGEGCTFRSTFPTNDGAPSVDPFRQCRHPTNSRRVHFNKCFNICSIKYVQRQMKRIVTVFLERSVCHCHYFNLVDIGVAQIKCHVSCVVDVHRLVIRSNVMRYRGVRGVPIS